MNRTNDIYDKKMFWKSIILIALAMLAQKLSGGDSYVVFILLAFIALLMKNVKMIVLIMLISIMFMMGNSYIMPRGGVFFVVQRIIFLLIGLFMLPQLFGHKMSRAIRPYFKLFPYVIFMIFTAPFGWQPTISLLKIMLFLTVFGSYIGVAHALVVRHGDDIRQLRSIVLAVASYIIIGSVIVLPFPAVGQLTGTDYLDAVSSGRNVISLFRGMTTHSQALGPIVSTLFVFLLGDLAFNVKKACPLYIVMILMCPFLVFKSSSRAGMVSLIMGLCGIAFVLYISHDVSGRIWRSKMLRKIMFAIAAGCSLVMVTPSVRQSVVRFAIKYGDDNDKAEFSMDKAMSTRQGLIDEQLENFEESPAIGNGFQVSSDMKGMKVSSWKQLASAPVEKGVWLTAILEEGGVIGMILVAFFVIASVVELLRAHAYQGLTLLLVLLVSNMAEFTMFSMSAMGGFIWAIIFIGAAFDGYRLKKEAFAYDCLPYYNGERLQ